MSTVRIERPDRRDRADRTRRDLPAEHVWRAERSLDRAWLAAARHRIGTLSAGAPSPAAPWKRPGRCAMNDWMRINRIRGPVYILTAGVLGLLAEFTRYGWSRTWPVWIIVTGLLKFAQHNARRHAIANGEIPEVSPLY